MTHRPLKSLLTSLPILLLSCLLAACGSRGELYLPEEGQSGKAVTKQEQEQEQENTPSDNSSIITPVIPIKKP